MVLKICEFLGQPFVDPAEQSDDESDEDGWDGIGCMLVDIGFDQVALEGKDQQHRNDQENGEDDADERGVE